MSKILKTISLPDPPCTRVHRSTRVLFVTFETILSSIAIRLFKNSIVECQEQIRNGRSIGDACFQPIHETKLGNRGQKIPVDDHESRSATFTTSISPSIAFNGRTGSSSTVFRRTLPLIREDLQRGSS